MNRYLLPLAVLFLVACGPSETDRVNMKEMMALEAAQAAVWTDSLPNCAKLARESTAFNNANKDQRIRLHAWWDSLSTRTRKKLLEESKSATYVRALAMMKAMGPCPNEIKAASKGE
jgi:hypothetical protein